MDILWFKDMCFVGYFMYHFLLDIPYAPWDLMTHEKLFSFFKFVHSNIAVVFWLCIDVTEIES